MENMGFLHGIRRNGKYGILCMELEEKENMGFLHGKRREGN